MTGPLAFDTPLALDRLGERPLALELVASDAEREAIGYRLRLATLDALACALAVSRQGPRDKARVVASGRLRAKGAQRCAVSGEAVPFVLDAPIKLAFAPMPSGANEIELQAADLDLFPHDGRDVALGEAAVELLADLLPERPLGDAAALAEARQHLMDEETAARREAERRNPFGRLGR